MPDDKYVSRWRTIKLKGGGYAHVAFLNAAGRKKYHRKSIMETERFKGSKKTKHIGDFQF